MYPVLKVIWFPPAPYLNTVTKILITNVKEEFNTSMVILHCATSSVWG